MSTGGKWAPTCFPWPITCQNVMITCSYHMLTPNMQRPVLLEYLTWFNRKENHHQELTMARSFGTMNWRCLDVTRQWIHQVSIYFTKPTLPHDLFISLHLAISWSKCYYWNKEIIVSLYYIFIASVSLLWNYLRYYWKQSMFAIHDANFWQTPPSVYYTWGIPRGIGICVTKWCSQCWVVRGINIWKSWWIRFQS